MAHLQDPAYWASWAISHWSTMAISGVLCAIVGTYPFSHSSASVLLAFYWLVAAALISYAYALSTLFSKSRIAGTSTAVLYAVSMIPGCVSYLVSGILHVITARFDEIQKVSARHRGVVRSFRDSRGCSKSCRVHIRNRSREDTAEISCDSAAVNS